MTPVSCLCLLDLPVGRPSKVATGHRQREKEPLWMENGLLAQPKRPFHWFVFGHAITIFLPSLHLHYNMEITQLCQQLFKVPLI